VPTPWQPRCPVYPCRARLGRRNGTAQAPASAHALGLRRQSCQALLRSCPSPPACLCQARGRPAAPRLARRAAPLPLSRPHPGPAPHPLARRGRLPLAWPCRGALPSRRHAQGSRAARARHRLGRAAPRRAGDPAGPRARLAGTAGAKADQRGAAGCPVRRPPGPARRAALDGHAAAHPGSGRRPPVAARCWPPGRRPARMRPRLGSRRPPQPRQARRRPARCQARPRQPRRAPWPRPQHSTMGLHLSCLRVAAVVRLAACARNMHVWGLGGSVPVPQAGRRQGWRGSVCARHRAARSHFMPVQRLCRLGMQAHDCLQRTAQRGRVGQAVRAGVAGRCKPPARAPPGARHGRLQLEHGGGLARKLTAQLRLLRAQLAQQGRHLPMACGELQCMPAACAGAQCAHSTWHPGVAQRARATASAWRAGSGARGADCAACAARPAGPPLIGSDEVGNVRVCSVVQSLRLFPAPAGATQGRPGRPGRCMHFSRVLLPLVLLPHVTHSQPHACEGGRPAYARSRAPHLLCLGLRMGVRGQRRRHGRRVRRARPPLQSPAWRCAWPCGRRCAAARAGLRVPARQASYGLASRAGAGPVHPSGSDLCARGGSPARPVLCILACSYPPRASRPRT